MGCRVTLLGGEPDGRFEHLPEPTAENLAGVLAAVPRCGADVGFCQDPDADRLAVIDESGRYLGEEYTLALCVDHVLRGRRGPIVTNCSTSRMSEDLAGRYGVPYFRSAVGEANVVDAMLAHDAIFGGEGNGGPIDPAVGLVRDSFVGMARLLDAMAGRQMPISQLADELPRYAIVKTKITRAAREGALRPSTPWKSVFPTPGPTAWTACGSTGRAAGCWSAPATPSRSCGPSPRPLPKRKRGPSAKRQRRRSSGKSPLPLGEGQGEGGQPPRRLGLRPSFSVTGLLGLRPSPRLQKRCEFVLCHFAVRKDLPHESRADCLAGVNGDNSGTAVRVA